jgi:hypothetical protein
MDLHKVILSNNILLIDSNAKALDKVTPPWKQIIDQTQAKIAYHC